MGEITIGARRIGPGRPLYFIAEAGSNHDRDLGQARRLIDVAAEAGADAVKFQTFRAAELYPRSAGMTDYLKVPKSIYDIIAELEMPLEWIPELASHAKARGIDFLSTPFDERSADALEPYLAAYKIASYEMTHHGLVQHCARKGKPLIVSTGTATLLEVGEVVAAVRAVGDPGLVLLQCTAKYPAPLSALNLEAMRTMGREFGVMTGLSDHSREPLPGPMAATAMGAVVIEKHFTLDNKLPGPDHAYALEPHELADVIAKVREVERAMGSGEKVPQPEEQELRGFARRTIFVARPVAEGERLSVENLRVLRCGKLPYGLHPRELTRVVGRKATRALATEATLRAEDVGELALEEEGVALRPIEAGDVERVVVWRNRPEVQGQLFSARGPTREEHEEWFRKLQNRTEAMVFVIFDGGRPVGTVGLSGIDLSRREADYGILIGELEVQGRGVARRASQLILRYGFQAFGLERIRLSLFSDNAPARRLYDRLGFVEVGKPGAKEKDGAMREVTAMVLERARWA